MNDKVLNSTLVLGIILAVLCLVLALGTDKCGLWGITI